MTATAATSAGCLLMNVSVKLISNKKENQMATLREWLEEEGFDWKSGVIIAHTLAEGSYAGGWGSGESAFRFDFKDSTLPDTQANELLDHEFECGYGSPEAPRFVAEDDYKIYFPWQYDGSTGLQVVFKDISYYMDVKNETPYPGG
jgi:hypothetical protein